MSTALLDPPAPADPDADPADPAPPELPPDSWAARRLQARIARDTFRRHKRAADRAEAERQRVARSARWSSTATRVKQRLGKARTAVVIVAVNSFAGTGQALSAYRDLAPAAWAAPAKLAFALGEAATVESIALYLSWQAQRAMLDGAPLTAARLRVASYLVAVLVGGVNYSHFCNADWSPTAAAVVFALFSVLGPWLWGIHGRGLRREWLRETGRVDDVGAHFGLRRWLLFPVRTFVAWRFSIDYGYTDSRAAWTAYRRARTLRRAWRRQARAGRAHLGPVRALVARWLDGPDPEPTSAPAPAALDVAPEVTEPEAVPQPEVAPEPEAEPEPEVAPAAEAPAEVPAEPEPEPEPEPVVDEEPELRPAEVRRLELLTKRNLPDRVAVLGRRAESDAIVADILAGSGIPGRSGNQPPLTQEIVRAMYGVGATRADRLIVMAKEQAPASRRPAGRRRATG
jgi:hypothetical protein